MQEDNTSKNNISSQGIVICSICGGKGFFSDANSNAKDQVCPECEGVGVWLAKDKERYFWKPRDEMTSFLVQYSKTIESILLKAAGVLFVSYSYYKANEFFQYDGSPFFWFYQRGFSALLFWVASFVILYWIYSWRLAVKREYEKDYDIFKIVVGKFPKAEKENGYNIEPFLDYSVSLNIYRALELAKKENNHVNIWYLLKVFYQNEKIEKILARLEVDQKKLIAQVDEKIAEAAKPILDKESNQYDADIKVAILGSLREAVKLGRKSVNEASLFVSIVLNIKDVHFFLQETGISSKDLHMGVLWSQRKSKTIGARSIFGSKKPKRIMVKHRVMNRSWTARQTPVLDRFSYDLTDLAAAGVLPPIVDREEEVSEVMRILERNSKNNILLVGETGSGRRSIVRALARLMISDNCLPKLKDKRLVALDASMVVSGVRAGGDLEARVQRILKEIQLSGNIVLFIADIHNLADSGSQHGFDVSEILTPVFKLSTMQVIGTTTFYDYHHTIEKRGDFADTFDVVKIEEVSPDIALEIVSRESYGIERKEEVFFTFNALKKAVELSQKYITNKLLPAKAVDLLSEAAVMVRVKFGKDSLVESKHIMQLVTEKTGVPVVDISSEEAEKLIRLESEMHKRMIGQDLAVKTISEAIKRMRVGLKHEKRPMGVFLFLGPTGVGKTELAKTLAEVYFGSEKLMIRLDMSEFQTSQSIEKLIGSPDGSVSGQLTEAVKNKPFSLVLLDEFEKANPNVLNLFLQVFDDGRLTDGLGRLIDFSNTIIIATSNAGSKIIQERLAEGMTIPDFQPEFEKKLLEYFKPELLNRFNAQIIFKTLTEDDISKIAKLQIAKLSKRFEAAQGIEIKVTDEAVAKISRMGYNPFYGARNLQRVITEKVENIIADKFLKGEIKRGRVFTISDIE